MASSLDAPPAAHSTRGDQREGHVAIRGVSVSYDGVPAVREVDLDIAQGEIVALLGPSGCGKTTLLRAIAGLERPTEGTVTIAGTTVSGPKTWVAPQRRQVGMVFQDGALFPHLTVADNVAFGLRGRRRQMTDAERRRRVADLLELVDLPDVADRLPETLSGGQQQRVALARSLAPEPSVLLLDEPFSALDASLRTQVRADVARILGEISVTTVFVTHDQDEAFVLGDRVAVMREGRIRQVDRPDGLYTAPASPWVAAFVGEANFVGGSLVTRDGGTPHAETPLGPIRLVDDASDGPTGADREVTVLVRPEQLELQPGEGAEVVDVEYYGHDVRYEIRLLDGRTLSVRTPSATLRARGDRVCPRFVGQPAVWWPDDAG